MLIDRIDVYLEGIHVERIESHSLLLSLSLRWTMRPVQEKNSSILHLFKQIAREEVDMHTYQEHIAGGIFATLSKPLYIITIL